MLTELHLFSRRALARVDLVALQEWRTIVECVPMVALFDIFSICTTVVSRTHARTHARKRPRLSAPLYLSTFDHPAMFLPHDQVFSLPFASNYSVHTLRLNPIVTHLIHYFLVAPGMQTYTMTRMLTNAIADKSYTKRVSHVTCQHHQQPQSPTHTRTYMCFMTGKIKSTTDRPLPVTTWMARTPKQAPMLKPTARFIRIRSKWR